MPIPVVDSPVAEAPRWSVATRIAFRFFFSFLLLINLPSPFTGLPYIAEAFYRFWVVVVQAITQNVFGVAVKHVPSGSGDTLFDWFHLLIVTSIAAIATLIWSIVDRKSVSYPRLYALLRMYVRFTLAFSLVTYGAFKVIQSQFPPPSADRLMQPIGDSSPMGLLWTLMGISLSYNIFTGLGEMVGGLLLTTRRTTLLGALVSAGVMAHVVMLNYSYDVPVKIYSTLLLLMALFLATTDARRLVDFFILNRTVAAKPLPPARKWVVVLRTTIVVVVTFLALNTAHQQRQRQAPGTTPAGLAGIWNVETQSIDGVDRPPLATDIARWRRVSFVGMRAFTVQTMDMKRTRYLLQNVDAQRNTITLQERGETDTHVLLFSKTSPSTLMLDGKLGGQQIHATLRAAEEQSFLLTSRGFHWINEVPFNK